MTITILGYRITLFKFERLEHYTVQIDHEAAKRQAAEIKNDPRFTELKRQAALLRAERS